MSLCSFSFPHCYHPSLSSSQCFTDWLLLAKEPLNHLVKIPIESPHHELEPSVACKGQLVYFRDDTLYCGKAIFISLRNQASPQFEMASCPLQ